MPEEKTDGCIASGGLEGLPVEVALARLPAGRHGLPRSFVSHNQRLRLVAAIVRLLPEHGYQALTIGHLTEEAKVSRAAFYQQFASKEECFLAALDVASVWLRDGVDAAAEEIDGWRERVMAGVAETLRLLAANPPVAHLMAVEVYRVGDFAHERQQAILDHFALCLRAGHPGRADLPDEMPELLLGGVVSLIGRYVASGEVERLPEATEALVDFILTPYLSGGEPGATLG